MTKIIAADRGKLRIGMAWGQNSIESVTPDYSGRITIDFRVPINDIENNIKAVQIQIHHQIQVSLTKEGKFNRRILQIKLFDDWGDAASG